MESRMGRQLHIHTPRSSDNLHDDIVHWPMYCAYCGNQKKNEKGLTIRHRRDYRQGQKWPCFFIAKKHHGYRTSAYSWFISIYFLTFFCYRLRNKYVTCVSFSLGVVDMNPTNEMHKYFNRPQAVAISLLFISLISGVLFVFLIDELTHESKWWGMLILAVLMTLGITCIYSLMLSVRGFRNK